MDIPIGIKGRIKSTGRYQGWTIWIMKDGETAFYFFLASPDGATQYDNWLLDYHELVLILEGNGITEVDWDYSCLVSNPGKD